jgi:hypothetical protein
MLYILLFHGNIGKANAPQCYVITTLFVCYYRNMHIYICVVWLHIRPIINGFMFLFLHLLYQLSELPAIRNSLTEVLTNSLSGVKSHSLIHVTLYRVKLLHEVVQHYINQSIVSSFIVPNICLVYGAAIRNLQ